MSSYFERLAAFADGSGSDRAFICRLHGYVMNDEVSKMSKNELAMKLQEVQFLLRHVYDRGSFHA